MGKHFKTDTHQLEQFVRTLKDSVTELDAARTALSHVRSAEIGTARLDEACDEFQDRWKYGSDQLSDMIGKIADGVKQNELSYRELEENLAKAFKKMEEVGTSAGAGKGGQR
jgi:exonuclease VII small subunit